MPVMKIVTVLPVFSGTGRPSVLVLFRSDWRVLPRHLMYRIRELLTYCRTVLTGLSVQQLNMMIHLTILIRFMSVAIGMPAWTENNYSFPAAETSRN